MTQRACLLLHGFTGGPYEVLPLAERLASRGWSCEAPTLPGHDGPLKELHNVRYKDWIEAAEARAKALAEAYGSFDLVGFSMGGLIAAYLANRYPVRRLALLSAAVYYVSPSRLLRNVIRQYRANNLQALRVKQGTPIGAVLEFMKLVRELKPELSKITTPVFVAQGELDEIVHPLSAYYIIKRVKGPKELGIYPNSRHMICLEPDAHILFDQVEHFFES